MTRQELDEWVAALDSGIYTQAFREFVDSDVKPTKHCCLAVYADLHNIRRTTHYEGKFIEVLVYPRGKDINNMDELVNLNDSRDCVNYNMVIEELKSHPENYITE